MTDFAVTTFADHGPEAEADGGCEIVARAAGAEWIELTRKNAVELAERCGAAPVVWAMDRAAHYRKWGHQPFGPWSGLLRSPGRGLAVALVAPGNAAFVELEDGEPVRAAVFRRTADDIEAEVADALAARAAGRWRAFAEARRAALEAEREADAAAAAVVARLAAAHPPPARAGPLSPGVTVRRLGREEFCRLAVEAATAPEFDGARGARLVGAAAGAAGDALVVAGRGSYLVEWTPAVRHVHDPPTSVLGAGDVAGLEPDLKAFRLAVYWPPA